MNANPIDKLRYLTEGDMPDALWAVEGAFRYDRSLQVAQDFLAERVALRRFEYIAGAMPCLWSLDYVAQRRPVTLDNYVQALEHYARKGVGVVLVFDNPFLTPEELGDSYGALLTQELYRRDRVRRNRLCVASDALAARLRELCPKLPMDCHPNRLIAEKARRTPALYAELAARYDRVVLHPADGSKESLLRELPQPERFALVVNDPMLRTNPVRRELLTLLSDMRRRPYDTDLMRRKADLLSRSGDRMLDPNNLQQQAACILTRREMHRAYELGFRRFCIQSALFGNEMTLLWDLFRCLFSHSPEHSHQMALIANSVMAEFGRDAYDLPSGLRQFSFSRDE
ncbi:MAG: hypothetical protein ACI4PZ_00775 [Akkermansia sp.]